MSNYNRTNENTARAFADRLIADTTEGSLQTVYANNNIARQIFRLTPIAAALVLSGCSAFSSSPTPTPSNLPLLPKKVYAEPLDKGATAVKSDVATLVFLRPGVAAATPATNDKEEPLNVYINGRFLASLLPGGYAEHEHCAGPVEVAAVFDDARIRYLGQRGHSQMMSLDAGKTYYVRLDAVGKERTAQLVTVPADTVWLSQYRRQAHAISRAPSCGTFPQSAAVPPAAAPAAVTATPVPTPLAAVAPPVSAISTKAVDEPLERWRAAWERGDFAAYSNSYASDFKGDAASHSAWEKQRRARLDNEAKKITLENIRVTEEGDTLVTRFVQNYQSKPYRDRGGKLLKWKKINGDWKIVQESFDRSVDLSAPVVAAAVGEAPVPATRAAAAGTGDDDVHAALERWRTAWEHGDFATYADSYARNFTGDQGSHAGWEKVRRERVQGKTPKITLENVEVSHDGDTTVTRFTQVYHADQHQDRGEKRLRWKMIRGAWRIVGESFQ